MIVVLGRPARAPASDGTWHPGGLAVAVATAAAEAGAAVELVGTMGDDPEGDAMAVALGASGVGHAALLRVAGVATPRVDDPLEDWPRLDSRDTDLALRYVPDCRVLVVAEAVPSDVAAVVLDAAAYHDAALVALTGPGMDGRLREEAGTVLVPPADAAGPFAQVVGRYAAALDAGEEPDAAFEGAVLAVGWKPATASRRRGRGRSAGSEAGPRLEIGG